MAAKESKQTRKEKWRKKRKSLIDWFSDVSLSELRQKKGKVKNQK